MARKKTVKAQEKKVPIQSKSLSTMPNKSKVVAK